MSDLESKAVDILTKFEVLAEKYTPEVIDLGLSVVRVGGAGNILIGIVFFIISMFAFKILRNTAKGEEKKTGLDKWDGLAFGKALMATLVGSVLFCISLSYLTYIWNWVAIFDPKLALAHKLLG